MDPKTKNHLALGRELYQSGDYARALPHLEAAREALDDFADVHNMLGFIHYDQGRPEDACRELERALQINPLYTEAALNLAVVYNELGRYDEGRALYEQVHHSRGAGGLDQLEPLARGKIANMHGDLADAYVALGLPDHAIKELQKALRVCPTFVDIRTKLANTLRDVGRFDEAIDEFQAICDLSPDYVPARTHYGVTLWRVGRVEEARVQWREVMERDPSNRSCQVYLNMTAPKDEGGSESDSDNEDADAASGNAPVAEDVTAEITHRDLAELDATAGADDASSDEPSPADASSDDERADAESPASPPEPA